MSEKKKSRNNNKKIFRLTKGTAERRVGVLNHMLFHKQSSWVPPSNWGSSINPSNASILSVARLFWQYWEMTNNPPSQSRASPVRSHKGQGDRETTCAHVCVCACTRVCNRTSLTSARLMDKAFFPSYVHAEAMGQGLERQLSIVNSA